MHTESDQQTLSKNELKEIHRRALAIYIEIKKLCDKYNIRYYAIGGTVIGSVRHHGIIPWDDDIDIGMPRKDYERFKEISHLLPEEYRFVDYSEEAESLITFGKVQDVRTCYTSSAMLAIPSAYYGVFVDIMPMDGMPKNRLLYRLHRQKLKTIYILFNLIILNEHSINGKSTLKRIIRNLVISLAKLGLINKTSLKRSFNRLSKMHDFDKSKYTTCLWQYTPGAGVNVAAKYRTSIYKSFVDMPFEHTTMRLPIFYHEYLNSLCPGYMTLPPKSKQIPHHSGLLDFNKSYIDYAMGVRVGGNDD